MKQDTQNDMRHVNASADLIAVFVITNNVEMMINSGVYAKNLLINVYVIKDLFGILVIVSVNVIKIAILANIWTIKIVNAENNQLRQ